MPMIYEIHLEAGLVRMAGHGAVTDQEMVDCVFRDMDSVMAWLEAEKG